MKTSQYNRLQGLAWFIVSLLTDFDDKPGAIQAADILLSLAALGVSFWYEHQSREAAARGD